MPVSHPAAAHLQVSDLGCKRGGRVLFRQLQLDLPGGTVLTLRGRNGSGKSSLLRTLAGLLPWRAGQLRWCGRALSAHAPEYQQQLSYLGHHAAMSDALSGIENLRFALTLAGAPWQAQRVQEVLQALGLARAAQLAFGQLSQGQRRRLGLARVLLADKALWLLDEPDNALDEHGLRWLGDALGRHSAAGGIAIVATHRGLLAPSGPVLDLSEHLPPGRSGEEAPC